VGEQEKARYYLAQGGPQQAIRILDPLLGSRRRTRCGPADGNPGGRIAGHATQAIDPSRVKWESFRRFSLSD
jgi:hypothetical protein